jgi:hypothetical protein
MWGHHKHASYLFRLKSRKDSYSMVSFAAVGAAFPGTDDKEKEEEGGLSPAASLCAPAAGTMGANLPAVVSEPVLRRVFV